MNVDEVQRRDIDELSDNTLSTVIDEHNTLTSPYEFDLFDAEGITGNNWIIGDESIIKYNLADDDKLTFAISQDDLTQKDISKVEIGFDVECGRSGAIVNNVKLSNGFVEQSCLTETVLNDQAHIDIDCQKFGLNTNELNAYINDELFYIVLCFNGKSLNTSIEITNPTLTFTFTDKLQAEIDVIRNRLGME